MFLNNPTNQRFRFYIRASKNGNILKFDLSKNLKVVSRISRGVEAGYSYFFFVFHDGIENVSINLGMLVEYVCACERNNEC